MVMEEELEWPISWGWLLVLGIVMVISGMLGLGLAFYLTLASVIMFGALIVASGILQL